MARGELRTASEAARALNLSRYRFIILVCEGVLPMPVSHRVWDMDALREAAKAAEADLAPYRAGNWRTVRAA